ncbi:MAG: CPBP family intramembrane metalloprotease [Ardenticatenaceae bacterium]|nr:CPBP family intramembrane metalloprotease [Ardenticatenaceae bacterium]
MNNMKRNLVIFTAVSLSGGFMGIAVDRLNPSADPAQSIGALIWLVSPLAASLLLRAFAGDGWQDAGFKPHLKSSWPWYLVAFLTIPLVTLLVTGAGRMLGVINLPGFADQGMLPFLSLAAATFGTAMVKNVFEEFAWRGYLTPRFAALGLHPFANAALTGFVWAGWHVPYYLYFLDKEVLTAHTALSTPVFIMLAFLVLPFHALAYGELRLLSGSVWPAWLMHTIANAISLSLISGGFMVLPRNAAGTLLSPGTEGIFSSLLMGIVGLLLYRHRQRQGRPMGQSALAASS